MGKSAFPETHELFFGWPGMHGPKWSNWAMNKCDLLVAVGARFDDRVTGQALGLRAGRHGDPPRHRLGRDRRSSAARTSPSSARCKQVLARPRRRAARAPGDGRARAPSRGCASSPSGASEFPLRYGERSGDMLKPQTVRRDARRRSTAGRDDVDLDDRRRPAPDVGDAVPPLRPAAHVHHLGRPRHDGLRAPGCRRREGGAAGRDGRLRRRRRLLPDDLPGARDVRARGPADRGRDRQQRLPRHGAAVAGHVLRRAASPRST